MPNDPLIEAIAVALSNEQGRTTFLKMAQAALAAITSAGYVVVPVTELTELLAAARNLCQYGHGDTEMRDRLRRAGKAYDAAVAALPAPPAQTEEGKV